MEVIPYWSPREIKGFLKVPWYVPYARNSRLKSVTTETIKTITTHIEKLKVDYPGYVMLIDAKAEHHVREQFIDFIADCCKPVVT